MYSGITLACVDCAMPELGARALEKSLEQFPFSRAKLFTDTAPPNISERIEVVQIPKVSSSAEYSRFMLKDLVRFIDTDFVQVVQWDGYVVRGEAWSNAFLSYDYIGARWWFRQPPFNVGNGGFSLRSKRLLDALQDAEVTRLDPEDNAICLEHRAMLEHRYRIRIAPQEVAEAYSFEGGRPTGREFGFHRMYNFPHFHNEAELAAVLDRVPDSAFSDKVALTLVRKLFFLGRNDEGQRYAARALSLKGLPAELIADYEAVLKAQAKRIRRRG